MKILKDLFWFAAIAIASMALGGCILIPVAGFGYTGYQYHEKEGVFAPGQPLGGPAPADSTANSDKSSNSNSKSPPPTDNSIE